MGNQVCCRHTGWDSESMQEMMSTPSRGKRRRNYRSLVNSHKGSRKLPQLPSDPALSIFNNIHTLGVLEAELDVKKMELLVKKKRQEISEEIRRLSPEQRRDLIADSPYLRNKVHEAIYARHSPTPSSSPRSTKCQRYDNHETDLTSLQSLATPSSCPPSPSSSLSSGGRRSPQQIPTDDELASLYSSYTDLRTFNTSLTYDTNSVTYDNTSCDNLNSTFKSDSTKDPNSTINDSTLSYEELDSRTTVDLTNITQPAISYEVLTSSENTLKLSESEYTESNTEPSLGHQSQHSLTNGHSDHCVSDSISLHHSDPAFTTPNKKPSKRAEVCTPLHPSVSEPFLSTPLHPSVSEPSLSNNTHDDELSQSYDSVRSLPPVTIEEILPSKPLKKSLSEKSISEKLEEIQAKLSPRSSYLSQSSYHSYTLSYGQENEVLLGEVKKHRLKSSYSEDDIDLVRDAVDMSVAKQNLLNSLISPPEEWSDTQLCKSQQELSKSLDKVEELYKQFDIPDQDDAAQKQQEEAEEEALLEQVLDGLTDRVLNHFLSLHSSSVYNALPPYSAVDPETLPLPMVVPDREGEIVTISERAIQYFITCIECGRSIVLKDTPLPTLSSTLTPEEQTSLSSFHFLIASQSYELFMEAVTQFGLVSTGDQPPPWIREQCKGPRPSWLLPLSCTPSFSTLAALVSAQLVKVMCTALPTSIDQLLFKEELTVDIEWRDYHKDEVALKFRLADMLLSRLIKDTVNTMATIG